MIFVAIGTTDFNVLTRTMDELSPTLTEEVVIQIGRSSYVPQNCEYFRFAPSLQPYYERASVVVSHGGLGIVTEVMSLGKPLVAMEDVKQPQRHQKQLLQVWSEQKHLVWCRDVVELPEAILEAQRGLVPYEKPPCHIHLYLKDYFKTIRT